MITFNPKSGDVRLERRATGRINEDGAPDTIAWTNVPRRIAHHAADGGIEWGYAGSGAADLALLILQWHIREDGEPRVKCWKGRARRTAWELHQACVRGTTTTYIFEPQVKSVDD
jgi:hypothetical protein